MQEELHLAYQVTQMNFRIFCKWNLVAGVILIWTIKLFIRPYAEAHTVYNFILGIAPNLVGSYLVLFGTYLCSPLQFIFSSERWIKIASICFFALLLINECLQKIPIFGRTFDYYDIAASAVGLLLSYSFFLKSLATTLRRNAKVSVSEFRGGFAT
jgi:hypothetical protein